MFAPSAYSGEFVLNVVHEALGAEVIAGPGDADRVVTLIADYARLVRQITERTAGQAERGTYCPRSSSRTRCR